MVEGPASVGTKTSGYYGLNAFHNPAQVYREFRPCVLGYDTSCGGAYNLRGLPTWNLDTNVMKDIGIYKERVGAKFFMSDHQHAEPLPAERPQPQPHQPDDVWPDHRPSQHAAEHGVRNQTRLVGF